MIAMNLNIKVHVRLSQFGREAFKQWVQESLRPNPTTPSDAYARHMWEYLETQLATDWSEWSLWEIMSVFGRGCGVGASSPFVGNVITVNPKDFLLLEKVEHDTVVQALHFEAQLEEHLDRIKETLDTTCIFK